MNWLISHFFVKRSGQLSLLVLFWFVVTNNIPAFAQAQPIRPARNGTNTEVNQDGNRFDIGGGQRSGTNLFHDFERFGLNADQVANFLSNPEIRNILGRVSGGDISVIDGLIQVTGGNSNLYLMNPAGIIFGPNARLNVPAAFTATTANGIQFEGGWFNAVGNNNYSALVGDPNGFAFTMSQPGAIINAGELSVVPGQRLMLLGGSVINTGTLSAPGGEITIAAVPGENLVRINQDGYLLSLELPLVQGGTEATLPNALTFNPPSLPQLLTGSNISQVTGVTLNEDGTIALTGSGLRVDPTTGMLIASGSLDVSDSAPEQTGGQIQVLGDRVALTGATIDASGSSGGGTVLIGGNYRGQGVVPNASRTFVSPDSGITADALLNGDGGRVIVWADEATQFYGNISVRGGDEVGNGGFVEVSSRDSLTFRGTVDTSAANGDFGTLLLDPTTITIVDCGGSSPTNGCLSNAFVGIPSGTTGQVLFGDVEPTVIYESQLEQLNGNTNVVLQATDGIIIGDLTDNELTFQSGTGSITFTADANNDGLGSFSMSPDDTILTQGRSIEISGADVLGGNINSFFAGGSITIRAKNDIAVGRLRTGGGFGRSGFVDLASTEGSITVESIDTSGINGGNVNVVSAGIFRATGILNSFSQVSIDASGKGNPGRQIENSIPGAGGSVQISHGGQSFRVGPDGNSIPIDINSLPEQTSGTAGRIITSDTIFDSQIIRIPIDNEFGEIIGEDTLAIAVPVRNEESFQNQDFNPGDPPTVGRLGIVSTAPQDGGNGNGGGGNGNGSNGNGGSGGGGNGNNGNGNNGNGGSGNGGDGGNGGNSSDDGDNNARKVNNRQTELNSECQRIEIRTEEVEDEASLREGCELLSSFRENFETDLLRLEIQIFEDEDLVNSSTSTELELPERLTGGEGSNATEVNVNQNGQPELRGAGIGADDTE